MRRRKALSAKQVAAVEAVLMRLTEFPADFEVPEMAFDSDLLASLDDEIAFDPDDDYAPTSPCTSGPSTSLAPVVSAPGTKPISLRVENRILDVFKAKAKASGTKYQTLIGRALKATAAAWTMEAAVAVVVQKS